MKQICIFLIGMTLLGGCGDSGSSNEPEPAERETVFDPMVEALDKAKAVEGLEQDRKRRIDEQLEQN